MVKSSHFVLISSKVKKHGLGKGFEKKSNLITRGLEQGLESKGKGHCPNIIK